MAACENASYSLHQHLTEGESTRAIPKIPHRSTVSAIWTAYIRGQLANVGRAAMWWSTFGILSISLLDSDLALAASRGAFNLALLFAAPMAVAAAEKSAIRPLLINTTLGRMLLWTVAIPLAWMTFANWLKSTQLLWGALTSLMFLDGIAVAFANSVDVDCGGLDLLAQAYRLPVTNYLRFKYTALHQTVFDLAFMLFTPPCLFIIALISVKVVTPLSIPAGNNFFNNFLIGSDRPKFVLVTGVGFFFALLSCISLYYYRRGIPVKEPRRLLSNQWNARNTSSQSSWSIYNEKVGEVLDGLILVLSNPSLKWRLTSLATETALEDAMVSVVLPMLGLNIAPILTGSNDITLAALISVVLVAVGKLGGFLASLYLTKYWPNGVTGNIGSRQSLVNLVLLSSFSLILVPWSYYTIEFNKDAHAIENTWWERVSHPPSTIGILAGMLGIFLFFIFSTAPKIGFAALIQSAVSQDESEAAETFGFIGIFVTITDGLLIVIMNVMFYYIGRENFQTALLVMFALYLTHGLIEWKYGVKLIENAEEETLV